MDFELLSSIEMIGFLFNLLLDPFPMGVCFFMWFGGLRFLSVMQSTIKQYKKTYIDRHSDIHGSLLATSTRQRETILLERIFPNTIRCH